MGTSSSVNYKDSDVITAVKKSILSNFIQDEDIAELINHSIIETIEQGKDVQLEDFKFIIVVNGTLSSHIQKSGSKSKAIKSYKSADFILLPSETPTGSTKIVISANNQTRIVKCGETNLIKLISSSAKHRKLAGLLLDLNIANLLDCCNDPEINILNPFVELKVIPSSVYFSSKICFDSMEIYLLLQGNCIKVKNSCLPHNPNPLINENVLDESLTVRKHFSDMMGAMRNSVVDLNHNGKSSSNDDSFNDAKIKAKIEHTQKRIMFPGKLFNIDALLLDEKSDNVLVNNNEFAFTMALDDCVVGILDRQVIRTLEYYHASFITLLRQNFIYQNLLAIQSSVPILRKLPAKMIKTLASKVKLTTYNTSEKIDTSKSIQHNIIYVVTYGMLKLVPKTKDHQLLNLVQNTIELLDITHATTSNNSNDHHRGSVTTTTNNNTINTNAIKPETIVAEEDDHEIIETGQYFGSLFVNFNNNSQSSVKTSSSSLINDNYTIIAMQPTLVLSIDKQAYNSLFEESHNKISFTKSIHDLTSLITNPDGYNKFYTFLNNEQAAENLIFWKEIQIFDDHILNLENYILEMKKNEHYTGAYHEMKHQHIKDNDYKELVTTYRSIHNSKAIEEAIDAEEEIHFKFETNSTLTTENDKINTANNTTIINSNKNLSSAERRKSMTYQYASIKVKNIEKSLLHQDHDTILKNNNKDYAIAKVITVNNLLKNLVDMAKKIYDKFIVTNSPFQVNVAHTTQELIKKNLNEFIVSTGKLIQKQIFNLSINYKTMEVLIDKAIMLFNKASQEVFEMLKKGNFLRYMQTEEYVKFINISRPFSKLYAIL